MKRHRIAGEEKQESIVLWSLVRKNSCIELVATCGGVSCPVLTIFNDGSVGVEPLTAHEADELGLVTHTAEHCGVPKRVVTVVPQ